MGGHTGLPFVRTKGGSLRVPRPSPEDVVEGPRRRILYVRPRIVSIRPLGVGPCPETL